ncbi:hypothetical protein QKU48_gp1103 [Fadolivirus algeromassiliense]|jgi:hypothetical protein|uniref:Spore protein YkvP/CgeB glycosyl transferase-like domain-containing protein n=1 Tax=Fadolivirus FV1/VV64 TaxID=3070911 RepID=A0A7D3R1S9_9VIRU|nr:hypothetical protein QKU48_gp1103 [Fadolivirus algeromassiliense]QKF94561.1 hypothetical protein Fadolivirus_1_1103 [Fadolivirus FV1/VV64]
MKLLITSYYGLRESLLSAANSLRKLGITVIDFHLFELYKSADNDKLSRFDSFIKKESPHIILWWYIGIPINDMKHIVENNLDIKHVYFNWDDPYNWNVHNLSERCKFFDYSFICCEQSIPRYLQYGSKNVDYILPGYDPQIHNIILFDDPYDVSKYTCDISFCCTNLYESNDKYPNQYINRKELIDNIYNNQEKYNFTFHIYGPEFLGILYPKSYKGFIKYNDTNKLFNYSKINLCTHVQQNAYKYLNERAILILGSGGLLYVDRVDGLDQLIEVNKECVIIDKNNYIQQIRYILDNYDKYYLVRHNGNNKSRLLTWNIWASKIHNCITNLWLMPK